MDKPLSAEALTKICHFLLKRSDEAHARAETLRLLLEKHCPAVTAAEFDALFAQTVTQQKQKTKQWLTDLLTNVRSEEIRQFLATYEGTVQ